MKIILRFYENQFVTSVQRNSELERRKLVEVSNTQGKKNEHCLMSTGYTGAPKMDYVALTKHFM